ncbi:hypothetical protein GCM10009838_79270 [Catenulispora subtropica]|uniref:Uncharacterized protein n=1 Tax=Catenulispora subtropica TaxID=450798 RepID=A0ABN2T8P4_9ACTN
MSGEGGFKSGLGSLLAQARKLGEGFFTGGHSQNGGCVYNRYGILRKVGYAASHGFFQSPGDTRLAKHGHRGGAGRGVDETVGEEAEILFGYEGQAGAALVELRTQDGRGAVSDDRFGQFGDVPLVQGSKGEVQTGGADRTAIGAAEDIAVLWQFFLTISQKQTQVGRGVAGEQEKEFTRGLVGPVDILDGQQRRAESCEYAEDCVGQPGALGTADRSVGRVWERVGEFGDIRSQLSRDWAERDMACWETSGLQSVDDWPKRQRFTQRVAPTAQYLHSARFHARGGFVEEA